MGLWQQIKSGQMTCEESRISVAATSGIYGLSADDRQQSDVAAGKALIARTVHQIADLWNEVEKNGGSPAWEWIFNGSHHGKLIHQAADRANAAGSRGKYGGLESACNAWRAAWPSAIWHWTFKP